MRTTSFKSMECPTARALDCIGESWTLLILRDALQGCTRFDEFQRSVGIATNTLTRRLKRLVDQGLLERRRYMTRPTRYEYVLTQMGIDLFPLLVVLFDWGASTSSTTVSRFSRSIGRAVGCWSPWSSTGMTCSRLPWIASCSRQGRSRRPPCMNVSSRCASCAKVRRAANRSRTVGTSRTRPEYRPRNTGSTRARLSAGECGVSDGVDACLRSRSVKSQYGV